MKKLIILIALAFTTLGYSQAEFEKIAITENTATAETSRIVSQQPVGGELNYINATALPVSTATLDSLGLKSLRESGVLDFDGLAINSDPTKFDIGAGFGFISNSLTGGVTKVTWTAQTAQTTPYLATSVATYVLKDDTGTTVLQNSYPTNEQFRTHIYLGKLAHTTFTTISFVVNDPSRSFSVAGDFHDFVNSIGSINIDGNAITPNGANLNINVSAGRTYREGANFMSNRNSPNITTEPAVNNTAFRNKFRNGSGGWNAVNTSTVDPNYYDNGSGILQLVANNKFTVKVVYRFGGTGTIHMDYGQVVYDDLNAADAGIANSVASDPDTKGFASRIGWIIVKQGTTSLLTSGNYKFVAADLFGVRAATSAPATTLQAAYDGSVTPQITTSTGGGAVTIRNGSASDTNTTLQGQNIAGTVTYSVKGSGEIYTAATPTATAFTHYFGETASDGIVRPKTLANVKTEIVTTAAVDAAKPNIITGTGTTNTISKWTGANTQGNSNITDNGTIVSTSTDMSVNGIRVGRGTNNIATNTALGTLSLNSVTTGVELMAIGFGSMQNATNLTQSTAIGSQALNALQSGNAIDAIGRRSLYNLTTGSNILSIGFNSGQYLADKTTPLTSLSNSMLLGYRTSPLGNGESNIIVIGYDANSLGPNTSVIGNSSTTFGRWWGRFLVGKSTDDGVNDGQFNGTVASGATTLGASQPTANNQLTRKDFVDAALALKANLASPAFTGTPTAPTATVGTNTTQIATTAFVSTATTNNGIITTAVSITNATNTDASLPQNGKTLYISNGANNINYTVNGSITASFVKGGTGSITFVQGSGRTMVAANGTLVFNGAQYSTASVVSFSTTDIVYINNF